LLLMLRSDPAVPLIATDDPCNVLAAALTLRVGALIVSTAPAVVLPFVVIAAVSVNVMLLPVEASRVRAPVLLTLTSPVLLNVRVPIAVSKGAITVPMPPEPAVILIAPAVIVADEVTDPVPLPVRVTVLAPALTPARAIEAAVTLSVPLVIAADDVTDPVPLPVRLTVFAPAFAPAREIEPDDIVIAPLVIAAEELIVALAPPVRLTVPAFNPARVMPP